MVVKDILFYVVILTVIVFMLEFFKKKFSNGFIKYNVLYKVLYYVFVIISYIVVNYFIRLTLFTIDSNDILIPDKTFYAISVITFIFLYYLVKAFKDRKYALSFKVTIIYILIPVFILVSLGFTSFLREYIILDKLSDLFGNIRTIIYLFISSIIYVVIFRDHFLKLISLDTPKKFIINITIQSYFVGLLYNPLSVEALYLNILVGIIFVILYLRIGLYLSIWMQFTYLLFANTIFSTNLTQVYLILFLLVGYEAYLNKSITITFFRHIKEVRRKSKEYKLREKKRKLELKKKNVNKNLSIKY